MTDRHVLEALGRTYVVVEDGNVVEVGEPLIKYCPIFAKARGIKTITPDIVKQNIKFRIADFGMCTGERAIEMEVFVGFGASEVMMTGLRRGLLDATVSVCEGAGTIITSSPTLTQGIGARISGVLETTTIPKLVKRIEEKGGIVLDGKKAIIDQPLGVERAIQLGHKKIAVTVTSVADASACRGIENKAHAEVTIIAVHATGINKERANRLIQEVDITTSCASLNLREVIKGKALAQVGTAVPLFALTQRGKELLLERAKEISNPLLINTMELPVLPDERQPRPLV